MRVFAKISILLLIILPFLLVRGVAQGESVTPTQTCEVSGFIFEDTTWTADCTYILVGSIIVKDGFVLTIEPGTTVKFNNGKGLSVDGTLIAQGTELSPIIFTSNEADTDNSLAPGDWTNIFFSNSSVDATFDIDGNYLSGSIIQYSLIEYAGSNLALGAIQVENSSPFISESTVRNNDASGIYALSSDVLRIINNNVSNNFGENGGGIFTTQSPAIIGGNTVNDNVANFWGGGIYAIGANSINDNIVADNSTTSSIAGGIYAQNVDTISDNTITGNTASNNNGGGIYATIVRVISDNIISDNMAVNSRGGGIFAHNVSTISGNYLTDNSSGRSGGGVFVVGNSEINGNTIDGNSAGNSGGGIGTDDGGTRTITGNTISGNSASNGGGIRITGTSDIGGNTITGNSASGRGGGIKVDASANVHNNIITDNSAGAVQGGGGIDIPAPATLTFNNNEIHGNTSLSECNDLTNLRVFGSADVNAENNDWGTSDPNVIEGCVWHFVDDGGLGIVNYIPFLGPGPIIEVSPVSLNQTLIMGQSATDNLIISNGGESDLNWNITVDPEALWLSILPLSGTVSPGSQQSIQVNYASVSAVPGENSTIISVNSNDPVKPQAKVSTNMSVFPICTLVASAGYTDGKLGFGIGMGTKVPMTWSVWLSTGPGTFRLWSLPLPKIDPSVNLPRIEFPFPSIGTIAIFNVLSTAQGIQCYDINVISTGSPGSTSVESLNELRDLIPDPRNLFSKN